MSSKLRELWESAGGKAPLNWSFHTIEELLENPKSISVGVMYPGTHSDGGVPLIKVSDVKNGRVLEKPSFCISPNVDFEYRRTKLNGTELLITLVGEPGDCVITTKEMSGWNVARALAVMRLADTELRSWIRYVLLSKPAKHLISSRLNTTVQKTLNLKDIREMGLPVAPEKERNSITKIIDDIENKILINNQINQTLEAMAQAIFKSWFVDFEPVKAKVAVLQAGGSKAEAELAAMMAISGKTAEQLSTMRTTQAEAYQQLAQTAALFPVAMQDSELGGIPEGWEVLKVNNLVKRLVTEKRYGKSDVKSFGMSPIYEQGANILLGFHDENAGLIATKENPIFIFGDHTCVMHISCKPFDVSANVIALEGKLRPTVWTYYALLGKQTFQEYRRHWSELIVKDVVTPTEELATKFTEIITEKICLRESLTEESLLLIQQRDSLLPKLLTGEIDITTLKEVAND